VALNSLSDLLLHELKDLYSAERQLTQALPKMIKACKSAELAEALTVHLAETEGQIQRIERAFGLLDHTPRSQKCKGMEGLLEEGKSLLEEDADPDVLDAAIIGAAQRVEHYEIAAYGTAIAYARTLGLDDVAALLAESLDEERAADEKLSVLAEGGINALAHVGEAQD
jgi:ferritin-like metal-binding protein YciE